MTAAPTDGELSALVAEHVAGWEWWMGDLKPFLIPPRLPPEANVIGHAIPPYATSADAVIPVLCEKYPDGFKIAYTEEGGWGVEIYQQVDDCKFTVWLVDDESLPRAICLALLRAHGVTGI